MKTNQKFSGYMVAIGLAIVVFCTQGALGTFGVFLLYIVESDGWSVSAVSFMATCCSTVVFVMNTLMYKAISKMGGEKGAAARRLLLRPSLLPLRAVKVYPDAVFGGVHRRRRYGICDKCDAFIYSDALVRR